VGERGQRRERDLLVVAAEHPEQLADPAERLASGPLDRLERQLRGDRVPARRVLRRVGLAHHRRERVADHVVQLAGDPRALVRHGSGGACGAVALHRGALVLQRLVEPCTRARAGRAAAARR
jgi:hypothetical protein